MDELVQHRTAAPVRLRFVLKDAVADMAVPVETPLIDVLPVVLSTLDPQAGDHGAGHDGWVLQRIGAAPLDEERTPADLDLLDGDTVHLRPRAAALPPIGYDDLIDGLAEQVEKHQGTWSAGRLRAMLLTFGGLAVLTGLPVLALGGPAAYRALAAATATLLLVGAAGLASRAAADPVAGTLLAGCAAAYAAAAGWTATQWAAPGASWTVTVSAVCLCALATVCAGFAAVADGALLFTGAITALLLTGAPAVVAAAGGYDTQRVAGTTLVVTLVVMMVVPLLAFRLGGLLLPMMPRRPEQLSEDIDPIPYRLVVERGNAAVGHQSALLLGVGVAQLPLVAFLVLPGGAWPRVLGLVTAALLLLRARHLTSAIQRWTVLIPATGLVVLVLLGWGGEQQFYLRVVALPVLATIGLAFLAASTILPGRRLRPYWARAADILELVVALAVLPVLGAVLGVYAAIRAWAG
ncbi:type VII secretion integral membrane protein EccD [Micromonospora sp. WMMD1120]|uniref:type VII secretion integral membrane protein EccD n=1 Tax=Micromonospora sp. WMMD1120 TaxID=3016106 RepID=UPI002417AF61|nr:type VII secretion integral membrane protein EccD [Micromonospora sp. WMMD1120]MDG4809481.1 type VII secretion integral membrane protein EccD [Micromonospora sp. WMMD1120]